MAANQLRLTFIHNASVYLRKSTPPVGVRISTLGEPLIGCADSFVCAYRLVRLKTQGKTFSPKNNPTDRFLRFAVLKEWLFSTAQFCISALAMVNGSA